MFEDKEIKSLEVEVCDYFTFDFPHTTFYDHVTEFLVIGCLLPNDTVDLKKLFGDSQSFLDRSEEVFGLMTEYMQKKVERKLRENSIDIMETILEFYDPDPNSQREVAFLVITIARELCFIQLSKSDCLQRKFNIEIESERRFLEAIEKVISNFDESSSEMISNEDEDSSLSSVGNYASQNESSEIERTLEEDSLDSCAESRIEEGLDQFFFNPTTHKDKEIDKRKFTRENTSLDIQRKDKEETKAQSNAMSQAQGSPTVMEINFKKSLEHSPKMLRQGNSKSTIKILPRIHSQRSAIKKKAASIISSVKNLNLTLNEENSRFRGSISPEMHNCYKITDQIFKTSRPVVDYSWKIEAKEPLNLGFKSPGNTLLKKSIKNLTMTKSYAFEKSQFKQYKVSSKKDKNGKRSSLEPQALAGLIRKSLKKESFKGWSFKKVKTSRLKSGKILTEKERQMKSFDQPNIHKSIQNFHFSKKKNEQVSSKRGLTERRRITMSPCIKNGLKLALINKKKSSKKSITLKSYTTKKFSIYDRIPSTSPSKHSKISSCSAFDSVTLYKKKKFKEREDKPKEQKKQEEVQGPAPCPLKLKLDSIKHRISFMSPGDKKLKLGDIKSSRVSSIRSSKFGQKMKFDKLKIYTDRSRNHSRNTSRQTRNTQVNAIRKILDKPRSGFQRLKTSIINSTKSYKKGKENQYGFSDKARKFPEPGSFLRGSMTATKREEEGIISRGKVNNSKIMNLLRKKRSRDILKQFDKNKDGKQKFSFTNRARLYSPNFDKLRLVKDPKKPKIKTEIGMLSSRFKNTSYFDNKVLSKMSIGASSVKNRDEKSKTFLKENFDIADFSISEKKRSLGMNLSSKKGYMKKIYGIKDELIGIGLNDFEPCR